MLKLLFYTLLLALPAAILCSIALSTPPVQDEQKRPVQVLFGSLTEYHVGVFKTGPKWSSASEKEIHALVKKNAKHLEALVKSGTLVGVAEVAEVSDWKLIVFFKGESEQVAREILQGATAVKEGLLTADVYTVWGTRGLGEELNKEMKQRNKATYYLTILSKGKAWTEKPGADKALLVDAHASNVLKLKDAGVLKFYGAVEGSSGIRNISIVSAKSAEDVKTKLAAGPLIQKEWFVAKVLTCRIAEGTLP